MDPATMTKAQLRAWEREVAVLLHRSLLAAERVFEPRPPVELRRVDDAVPLEAWAAG